jgi:hypothetical protein
MPMLSRCNSLNFDGVAIQCEEEFELIAAQWVVPLRGTTGLRHLMEIPGLLAVVENDLLIKVVQIIEHVGSIAGCWRERKQILERASCDA